MKHPPAVLAVTMLLHFANGPLTAVDAQTPIDSTEVVTRRVMPLGPLQFPWSKMSAAGGNLVYTDWSQLGSLYLLDLAGGEAREVVKAKDSQFSEFSVVSPDGKQIAYAWFNGEVYDLRIVGIDGSEPRVLFENPEVYWLGLNAWSPDGSQILALFVRRDNSRQLALISTRDGSHRVLRTLGDWRGGGCGGFSPDGKFVACQRTTEDDSEQQDIFALATDGSREIPVIRHPADDEVLGWAPDGTILFLSDRSGTPSAWAIRTEGGEPRGEPFMIKADLWGIENHLGFTGDGSFYYSVDAQNSQVFIATLDSTASAVVGASIPVGVDYRVLTVAPDWSPDGRHLAFLTDEGSHYQVGSRGIVVRSMATGETRKLVPHLADVRSVQWTSDGLGFFTIGIDDRRRRGLYRIDAQTAEIERIDTGDHIPGFQVAAGESSIYYDLHLQGQAPMGTIVAHDLRTGQEQELYTFPGSGGPLALSPDGNQLATAGDAGQGFAIQLLPTAGGAPHTIMPLPDGAGVESIAWTPDGQHLLVNGTRPASGGRPVGPAVFRVPIAGGEPTFLPGIRAERGPRVHPDGRQIAFAAGVPQFEIWVMENIPLLEPLRTSASRR